MEHDSPPPETPDTEVAFRFAAPAERPVAVSHRVEDVLAAAGLPPRLDGPRALGLIATGHFDSYHSFFSNVALVPPYVPCRRTGDGVLEAAVADGPAPIVATAAEAASRFADAILAATRRALAPARRPAVLLSGGLDSSTVAWAATEAWRDLGRSPDALTAYHLLPEWGPSEAELARAVASTLGLRLELVSIPPGDPWEGTEAFLRRLPFPPDGAGVAELLAFHHRVRSDGIDVVLTGDGGDEAATAHAEDDAGWIRAHLLPFARRWARPLLRARGRHRELREAPEWLRAAMRGLSLPEPSPAPRRGLAGAAASRDRLLRCARQQAIVAFHRAVDEGEGSRTSFPFLDREVVDVVVALPAPAMRGDGRKKALLRLALAGRLPPVVVDQRKEDQPYVEPLRREELRRHGASWRERYVGGGALERAGILPADAGEPLLRRAIEGDGAALWRFNALASIEVWARARGLSL